MTIEGCTAPPGARLGSSGGAPAELFRALHWTPVLSIAASLVAVLLAVSDRYGYNVDELYYRLLGQHGLAWGYTDQPPLVPLIVRLTVDLSGDALWALRVPAAVCAGAVVVLGAAIAAELGGGRRAQVLTAVGLASSVMVQSIGHVMVTTTVDLVAWSAVALFAVRALLRDGRWWIWAGVTLGLALYAKYVVVLLPVALLAGVLLVGPRPVLRERHLLLGVGLAFVIGVPNLVYQLVHDLPQLRMAEALSATDGPFNRVIFLPSQVLLLGLALTPVWIAGVVGLLRRSAWRPVRAVAVAYLVAVVLALVGGGRPDYVGGFLVPLLAAGFVVIDAWIGARIARRLALGALLAVGAVAQAVIALPLLPERSLARLPLNNIALESVGWPQLVEQVAAAHQTLPADRRGSSAILARTIGEAGALDRYGAEHDLPAVYSGHNELHRYGPPPETVDVVIAVGFELDDPALTAAFARCEVIRRVDNGLGVANAEQGQLVVACGERRSPWASLWPSFAYLSG
jgi:hypothetical protein